MNEDHEGRNQTERLIRGFKRTGLAPPVTEWQPTPTGGDRVREVIADITDTRETEIEAASNLSKSLWGGE